MADHETRPLRHGQHRVAELDRLRCAAGLAEPDGAIHCDAAEQIRRRDARDQVPLGGGEVRVRLIAAGLMELVPVAQQALGAGRTLPGLRLDLGRGGGLSASRASLSLSESAIARPSRSSARSARSSAGVSFSAAA